jgi:phosphate starvation-inducible PhoH-like protein
MAQAYNEFGLIAITADASYSPQSQPNFYLNDAFVILDEAQNTTAEQMKMFLTRLGFGSRAVITGDVTQIDLPTGRLSGLNEAVRVLGGVDGLQFVYFSDRDVVRHPIVQLIVQAYERDRQLRPAGADREVGNLDAKK